ncbi:MAG: hypothetical protein N0E55_17675 [Candidatus Thiodiazotropha taylori]|uniref:Uncharacterized protein n=1 Tax=Candidatus Thiodiazotropha taylori TaxID=2792791 RepID=A0A9E4N452_9GAMM|nr:hypothetical protein [Candidatus Thiodiazotropha taylori]MCG8096108.1 hypothetical protein [Candidatus Thiodiazotropha endolucinida]RLW67271.1 MAG: hypothetical protein B6D71_16765 [gamma proteobacterium symbiont of Stewartia floridana]MCG7947421.1 hypothetical protein [Candidatus Thiodiazotropha taylori]MCG7955699.1 hypothetical protein [Candidatus Thiodiazotropha taylori]
MTHITIKDLDKNEELDQKALRAVTGGNWSYFQNGQYTSMSIGNYGISNYGLSGPLASQLSSFGNYLNGSIMATQGNEAQMYSTVLGGVRNYRIATGGRTWGGFYPGGRGLFW